MGMSSNFMIVLTRTGLDSSNDDVIKVFVESYDWFRVEYTDQMANNSTVHYYNWKNFCNYLSSLRQLLLVDTEPFESIQLQVPGFPCVSLDLGTFGEYESYNSFLDVIEDYIKQSCNVH